MGKIEEEKKDEILAMMPVWVLIWIALHLVSGNIYGMIFAEGPRLHWRKKLFAAARKAFRGRLKSDIQEGKNEFELVHLMGATNGEELQDEEIQFVAGNAYRIIRTVEMY